MTEWQFSPIPSANGWSAADPYRYPGADAAVNDHPAAALYDMFACEDYYLPAPDAGRPGPAPLEPADLRRLDLHAALTAAGIAPAQGDLAAIDALCTLDDTTLAALRRWLTCTL
ncbi:hypothetical protein ACFYVL_34570 [Streptomyces sp. NPDC004111]|uniref:hypothetical protein n=1 Tax=Streptomyces sp. NPDC004111 TaxID=3364690 RepID=UPI0036B58FE4